MSMSVGEIKAFVDPDGTGYSQLATVLRRQAREAARAKHMMEHHGHGHGHGHSGATCSCAMSADPADLDLHKLAGNAVSYRLELMEVVPPGGYVREDWELSWAEKASAVPELKAAGNSLFALGD